MRTRKNRNRFRNFRKTKIWKKTGGGWWPFSSFFERVKSWFTRRKTQEVDRFEGMGKTVSLQSLSGGFLSKKKVGRVLEQRKRDARGKTFKNRVKKVKKVKNNI